MQNNVAPNGSISLHGAAAPACGSGLGLLWSKSVGGFFLRALLMCHSVHPREGCAPAPGTYNPKDEGHKGPASFQKSQRFTTVKPGGFLSFSTTTTHKELYLRKDIVTKKYTCLQYGRLRLLRRVQTSRCPPCVALCLWTAW